MLRSVSLLVLLATLAPTAVFAQVPDVPDDASGQPSLPPLIGQIDGNTYISPTGAFRITIPVLPELSGTITDTANVVTFQDPISTHISIAAFPQDATQRWRLEIKGMKDYLQEFFYSYVWRDFATNPQARYETSARFSPRLLGGAFFTYITLPGGSMFASPGTIIDPTSKPPVAKRGNLMFVHDGYVYVISTELAERVTEGSLFKKTSDEEDQILKERLTDIANRIHFTKPPPLP